jgi:hypothetical protein
MKSWQYFEDPRFELSLEYPRPGVDGEPVERIEIQNEELLRVHIRTPENRAVYFEISKYRSLTAEVEYQQHKDNLRKQFPEIEMTGLIETDVADVPAYSYSFEWESGLRTVVLVERDDGLYRILFNPNHPVNLHILHSLRWLNRD